MRKILLVFFKLLHGVLVMYDHNTHLIFGSAKNADRRNTAATA